MSGVDPVAHAEAMRERERRRSFVPLFLRQDDVGEAARIFASMSAEDRAVWVRMLRDGHDYARLVERCSAIKAAGADPAVLSDGSLPKNRMVTTPRDHVALASLLGTIRDHRRIVLKDGTR